MQSRRSRIRFWTGAAVLLVLLLAVGVVLSRAVRGPRVPPLSSGTSAEQVHFDPRLSYEGPYRNVHPKVAYVGDASCLSCHPKETASFHEHPMGRSLLPISQVAPQQVYDKAHNNPFQTFGFQFAIERQGDKIRHRHTRQDAAGNALVDQAMEVHYAIGSGRAGYSYLTDRDGYLFQTPISWYTQKQIWDLSPAFDPSSLAGRPVEGDCLFCHANRVRERPGYKNRYEEPIFDGYVIGCERCHGPGGRHIETAGKFDIVNPAKLTAALSDAVCEQCHLTGSRVLPQGRNLYDFRPGLPLADFFSVFVYATKPGEEEQTAVTHVEQMHASRCYQASSGNEKLHCASCHNPHHFVSAEQRVAHYRTSCLACHEKQGCALPREVRVKTSKEDSCIDCHMQRQSIADVAHTANTDHRILRKTGSKAAREKMASEPGSGWLLKPFDGGIERKDRQAPRDLGIALIQAAGRGLLPPRRAAAQAGILFTRGLAEDDSDAWEAQGWAMLIQKKPGAAQVAFEKALALQPQREVTLTGAAEAAQLNQQFDASLDYWRRAAKVNPWMPLYRKRLALLLMQKQLWDEVRSQSQDWMRLDPSNAEARMLWVTCLAHAGEKDKAREEFARIEALRPPNLEQLRTMFAQQMH